MKIYSILLSVLFFGLVSCKKDKGVEEIVAYTGPPLTLTEFKTCNCSIPQGKTSPEEYIRANINNAEVCADIKGYFQEPFPNMLNYGMIRTLTANTYYDNLYMLRETKDGRFRFCIYLENTHLLTKQFPYQLPRANPEVCEIGSMVLENLQQVSVYEWYYQGPFSGNRMRFTGEKFENGFFEGRFEGLMVTGSGKNAVVKDGKFRIKLTLTEKDIIVP